LFVVGRVGRDCGCIAVVQEDGECAGSMARHHIVLGRVAHHRELGWQDAPGGGDVEERLGGWLVLVEGLAAEGGVEGGEGEGGGVEVLHTGAHVASHERPTRGAVKQPIHTSLSRIVIISSPKGVRGIDDTDYADSEIRDTRTYTQHSPMIKIIRI
jgi:hypothetical protein